MPVVARTGCIVAPGDLLFQAAVSASSGVEEDGAVVTGEGCRAYYAEVNTDISAAAAPLQSGIVGEQSTSIARVVLSTRFGVAQWDGRRVSVFPQSSTTAATAPTAAPAAAAAAVASSVAEKEESEEPMAIRCGAAMGPRPGDLVHVRIIRLTRLFAYGIIIAVNGQWRCSSGLSALGYSNAFKGVLRVEDIRPFRPTKDRLLPPPPSAAYQPGDVVVAEVVSQSDAHQYQLSTLSERCGVVESFVALGGELLGGDAAPTRLVPVPGRRDVMVVPKTGEVVPRWCPLIAE